MSMNTVVLLLGSNLKDKNKNLLKAKYLIESRVGEVVAMSEIIETEPEDYISEHHFLNQTLKVETMLSPIETLNMIKEIETEMGRLYLVDSQRYQDRLIDIDILNFNALRFECKILTVPHPQNFTRNFIKLLRKYF